MSAGSRTDVYASVKPDGETWFRKRPKWNVKIIDGLMVYGPAYDGVVTGWMIRGDWEKAARFAQKKLAKYLRDEWPDPEERKVTLGE